MSNQVTLTFAGETKPLENGFDRVGASSKHMSEKVGESSDGFHRAGEAADELDTKAMGFRDTMTGVQDTMKGTSLIAKGDLFNGFLTLGMGVGDLGSGLYNFLIPALGKSVTWLKATTVGQKAAAGASRVWAAAQWLMNTALLASPITWIIVGIVAIVAVIVLIATKTTWFQRGWRASWGWIKSAASNTWDFLKRIPGWIGSAFSKVASFITAPFRAAFNFIARAWNATVGRLSFNVPGWVPMIGGNSFSVPRIPTFHSGGVVPGVMGTPVMALLQAGEEVRTAASRDSDTPGWVAVRGDGVIDALITAIAARMGQRGGRGLQLGIRSV